MVQLNSKDTDIFRVLSSGATSYLDIVLILEKVYKYTIIKEKGEIGDRSSEAGEMEKHRPGRKRFAGTNEKQITSKGLKNRLSELKREGYIVSDIYPRSDGPGVFALYALTPLSMAELINQGYDNNWIRSNLPKLNFIAHDKIVTETVRAIKREAGRTGYDFGIVDENRLREMYIKGNRSKALYPDLFVRITLHAGSEQITKRLNIEIDNNTLRPEAIADKVKKLDHKTIILCTNMQRIESLRRTFTAVLNQEERDRIFRYKHGKSRGKGVEKKDLPLEKKVMFALANDFHNNGLLRTNFISVDNDPVCIIEPEFKKKIAISLKA